MAIDIDLWEYKEEVAKAQEKLLKRMECIGELVLSWLRTCADISLLQSKKFEREENEILPE